jgi:hypothetical protein
MRYGKPVSAGWCAMSRRSDLKYGSSYGAGGVGKMPQVVNMAKAVHCVAMKQPFTGNNCHALWVIQAPMVPYMSGERVMPTEIHRNYVVYTGTPEHAFPLFVYDDKAGIWCENEDNLYGSITARQKTRLRPMGEIHTFDAQTVDLIAQAGFAYVAKLRLERKDDWRKELRRLLAIAKGGKAAWNMQQDFVIEDLIAEWRKKHVVNTVE